MGVCCSRFFGEHQSQRSSSVVTARSSSFTTALSSGESACRANPLSQLTLAYTHPSSGLIPTSTGGAAREPSVLNQRLNTYAIRVQPPTPPRPVKSADETELRTDHIQQWRDLLGIAEEGTTSNACLLFFKMA